MSFPWSKYTEWIFEISQAKVSSLDFSNFPFLISTDQNLRSLKRSDKVLKAATANVLGKLLSVTILYHFKVMSHYSVQLVQRIPCQGSSGWAWRLQQFFLIPSHVHTNFRGPPSWLWRNCNRLLSLGRPWGAVTLSRWCEWWYIGRWGARRGLKSRPTNYPDHGPHGDLPPTRKIPMVEPGIEPATSWLVVRSFDH